MHRHKSFVIQLSAILVPAFLGGSWGGGENASVNTGLTVKKVASFFAFHPSLCDNDETDPPTWWWPMDMRDHARKFSSPAEKILRISPNPRSRKDTHSVSDEPPDLLHLYRWTHRVARHESSSSIIKFFLYRHDVKEQNSVTAIITVLIYRSSLFREIFIVHLSYNGQHRDSNPEKQEPIRCHQI